MKLLRLLLACGLIATPAAATIIGPFVIFFHAGQVSVTRQARPILDNAALAMRAAAEARVVLAGYADHEGSPARMRALSCRRARAAQAYLASRGIARERMAAVGYGDDHPVPGNPGPQVQRRVELIFVAPEEIARETAGSTRC